MKTELWKQSYHLPNNLFAMGPTIFELWVMETENWVIKKLNPNGPLGCGVKSQKYQFKNPCLTCNNRKSLRQNSKTNIFCLEEKVHFNLPNLCIEVSNNKGF